MARKVFRYGPLDLSEDPQQIHIHVGAKIVHVESKHDGFIDIWAEVPEDTNVTSVRTFQLIRTGYPIPEDAQYIDTSIQTHINGMGVWHVYERLAD